MKTIVQKFGGSSLSSPELREIAASRVLESRARGMAPVVVCSALGRVPDPYATDTLAQLLGPSRNGPNRDLMLACGELIGCAVFAELLSSWGAPAQAMTGAQAGFRTDRAFGDAKILEVDATHVMALVERGIIPVVAGFQGATEYGETTTLGRGGSDLTAIALGHALESESVEIYTDVSGVMTGDPRRIAGTATIDRVNYAEMVELAGSGAKVMHHKAADYARMGPTPYVVKGLRSNRGTIIDDGTPGDRIHPVSGIASFAGVTFCRIIQGEADEGRSAIDLAVFQHLDEVRHELRSLNIALRARGHCAKISIVGEGMRGTSGVMYRVVRAITEAGIEIIHSTDSNITISLLVPEDDAVRAEQAIHDAFRLGREVQL
jgi:aspartate kinase